jgi:hypothetical protein
LKTGFERPRPSALSSLLVGNSFPSGHVATAFLVAGALGFHQWRNGVVWWKVGLGLTTLSILVSLVIGQRLYFAHHWLSDVIGSFLLTGAWLSFALPVTSPLRKRHSTVLFSIGLLLGYIVFYFAPTLRIALPSAFTLQEEPLVAFSFGEPDTQALLLGAWSEPGREPIGHLMWMRQGEASLKFLLPKSQPYTLRLAVRPFSQVGQPACFPLVVSVNQQPVSQVLLYRGWREYALHVDPTVTTPGVNLLTFRTGTDFSIASPDARAVAFWQLSFFAKKQ